MGVCGLWLARPNPPCFVRGKSAKTSKARVVAQPRTRQRNKIGRDIFSNYLEPIVYRFWPLRPYFPPICYCLAKSWAAHGRAVSSQVRHLASRQTASKGRARTASCRGYAQGPLSSCVATKKTNMFGVLVPRISCLILFLMLPYSLNDFMFCDY